MKSRATTNNSNNNAGPRNEIYDLRKRFEEDVRQESMNFEKDFDRLNNNKKLIKEIRDSKYLVLWTKHKNIISSIEEEYEYNRKMLYEEERRQSALN
jgi:hypothetical protein